MLSLHHDASSEAVSPSTVTFHVVGVGRQHTDLFGYITQPMPPFLATPEKFQRADIASYLWSSNITFSS